MFFLAPNTILPTSHVCFLRPFAVSHFPLKLKTFSLFHTAFCPLKKKQPCYEAVNLLCLVQVRNILLLITLVFRPQQVTTHHIIPLIKEYIYILCNVL